MLKQGESSTFIGGTGNKKCLYHGDKGIFNVRIF
jgi:hypothetical protein